MITSPPEVGTLELISSGDFSVTVNNRISKCEGNSKIICQVTEFLRLGMNTLQIAVRNQKNSMYENGLMYKLTVKSLSDLNIDRNHEKTNSTDWAELLASGDILAINLFLVPIPLQNQSYWGDISPGARYLIRRIGNMDTVYGYDNNKAIEKYQLRSYSIPKASNEFNLWGHIFVFNDDGAIYDKNPKVFSDICGQFDLPQSYELQYIQNQ